MTKRGREDSYYRKAKSQGYAARAAYKLEEMNKRYGLLAKGGKVVDLGSHPGSWMQYIARKVGASGLVVGVDLKPPTIALPAWAHFIEGDLLQLTPERFLEFSPEFDLVASDAAPPTTGVKFADAAKSLELAEHALELAQGVLTPGGSMVVKLYEGGEFGEYLAQVKRAFKSAKAHKPPASRSASREIYVVAKDFKKK